MDLNAFLLLILLSIPFGGIIKQGYALLTNRGVPKGDAAKYLYYGSTGALTLAAYALGLAHLPAVTCLDPVTCLAALGTLASAVALVGGIVYDAAKKAIDAIIGGGTPPEEPAPA